MMRFIFLFVFSMMAFQPVSVMAQDEIDPSLASEMYEMEPESMAASQEAGADVVAALPDPSSAGMETDKIDQEISEKLAYLRPDIDVNTMPSLFMSLWEHDLVIDARRGLITRDPVSDDGIVKEAGPRDITLSGIVYHSSGEWTLWLNSMRVSPTAIPKQVMDLKVFKSYIELEWFDENTNQIFPIRLRPHQRFNLDTRMFLPG